jgi:hypothetical protein
MPGASPSPLMVGINNAMIPKEGPKTFPITIDLTVSQSVLVDMSLNQALAQISMVQSLFVDNRENAQPTLIRSEVTGQVISIPPRAQAYVPILVPNPVKFIVASTGGVVVPIQVLNVPLPGMVIYADASQSPQYDDNGYMLVSDPQLWSLVNDLGDGPALNVNVVSGGGGGSGGVEGLPVTNYLYTGGFLTLLAATGTGARYRLTGIRIDADPTIFDASGGDAEVTWSVQQASTRTLFQGRFWLPKIAPSLAGLGSSGNPTGMVPMFYATGFQDVGTVNNEVLRLNVANAFSGGGWAVSVWGEPNYVPV